jgi:hypothetical protein
MIVGGLLPGYIDIDCVLVYLKGTYQVETNPSVQTTETSI